MIAVQRNLLKQHAPLLEQLIRYADPMLIVAAGMVVFYLYFDHWDLPNHYLVALAAGGLLCMLLFPIANLYQPQRGVSMIEEFRRLFYAWLSIMVIAFSFLFLTKMGASYSRVWIVSWMITGFALHTGYRILLRIALRAFRRHGYNLRHIAIVGVGELGLEIAARVRATTWSGFNVLGFYDDRVDRFGEKVGDWPLLGTLADLPDDIESEGIDQIWIALPLRAEERIKELLEALRQHSVQICFVPDIYGFHLLHHSFTEIAGLPVINLTDSPMQGMNTFVKAIEDYVLASIILFLSAPLFLAIALGVKLSSRGPVFYRQERITWNGTRFSMLKFRSMPIDCEDTTGPVWAKPGESRATPFGSFLRRSSLDELPQFINVLRGEMSIVGPRPERPELVEEFRRQIPGYMQKHLVKAGITGWAQVNDLRGNTDLEKRIQYDLYYIENWSLWFDLRIMALTLVNVFRSRNAY